MDIFGHIWAYLDIYGYICQGIGGKKRNGVRVGGGKIRMMGDPSAEFTRWEEEKILREMLRMIGLKKL